jgi:hypothetical protein
MNAQPMQFRLGASILAAVLYLWYDPSIHIAVRRLFS